MSYRADRSRHLSQVSPSNDMLRSPKNGVDDLSLGNELDVPLDAFDKQLLSELPQDRQQRASQGHAHISLPPRHQNTSTRPHVHQTIRGLPFLH